MVDFFWGVSGWLMNTDIPFASTLQKLCAPYTHIQGSVSPALFESSVAFDRGCRAPHRWVETPSREPDPSWDCQALDYSVPTDDGVDSVRAAFAHRSSEKMNLKNISVSSAWKLKSLQSFVHSFWLLWRVFTLITSCHCLMWTGRWLNLTIYDYFHTTEVVSHFRFGFAQFK